MDYYVITKHTATCLDAAGQADHAGTRDPAADDADASSTNDGGATVSRHKGFNVAASRGAADVMRNDPDKRREPSQVSPSVLVHSLCLAAGRDPTCSLSAVT